MGVQEDCMKTITIKSETITVPAIDEDGKPTTVQEIHPVIPFSEFPRGRREAGPDADGDLVWTVHVEE